MRFYRRKPVVIIGMTATLLVSSFAVTEAANAAPKVKPEARIIFIGGADKGYAITLAEGVCASNAKGLVRMKAVVWLQVKNKNSVPLTPADSKHNGQVTKESAKTSTEYSAYMTADSHRKAVKTTKKVRAKVKCTWTKKGDKKQFQRSAGSHVSPWVNVRQV